MNPDAATLAIRARLRGRRVPSGPLWRCLGEYAGGASCDGCGERITAAQATYTVDFEPGVMPDSARFHRVCFEIWQRECQVSTLSWVRRPPGCVPALSAFDKSITAMNLTLVDAFGRYGAKPANRQRALSAMAADGAMVLNCEQACFRHPEPGVLRYENRLPTESVASKDAQLLGQHLTLARDGALPVRMVVSFPVDQKSGSRRCHVRPDLIGRVVTFDGEHFVVDFERLEAVHERGGTSARK